MKLLGMLSMLCLFFSLNAGKNTGKKLSNRKRISPGPFVIQEPIFNEKSRGKPRQVLRTFSNSSSARELPESDDESSDDEYQTSSSSDRGLLRRRCLIGSDGSIRSYTPTSLRDYISVRSQELIDSDVDSNAPRKKALPRRYKAPIKKKTDTNWVHNMIIEDEKKSRGRRKRIRRLLYRTRKYRIKKQTMQNGFTNEPKLYNFRHAKKVEKLIKQQS